MTDNLDLVSVRRRILDAEAGLHTTIRAAHQRGDSDAALAAETEQSALHARYRDLLRPVAVARCPDTDSVVHYPMDVVGLDGWFWEYDRPIRLTPKLPPTWLAMTGAMRLDEPIPHTERRRRPGPGVPYVIPRLLRESEVRAVLTQVAIGPHTGWAVTYFGSLPPEVPLENTWGMGCYPVRRDGEWLGWNSHESPTAELDFDLRPWLRDARLLWVAPDDHTVALRDSVNDCPYLELAGPHSRASLVGGKVRRYT
ncbi:hypothetical protein NN3_23210 [Nocardia neocaledoniensis NBRC 108232]|uniref:Uncharacterized protein n=1 Tax=Nocardia neocaledoniensis TaxID=236511 RepID=A0A317N1J4_9NOCA|nr:hypothetical protein [Nocardia neocaledoniensis]PWV66949.1 hypothetical protein DFR69_12214 [Nocardia neocaledoniensis]GEM31314.1 hypothetical protein NN3_23210 [Nocardia neocaledoniensis NBRC 108232]